MLSVILYGRNDNHGYNLHKRAAISLNAIAEILTDPADEILFVDYNTPDDLPAFPEAIADTLTAKAVARLRVLRVRPAVHQAHFAARTHLNTLEPIARNVAIRRADPANKWVLSTNTDMIFCPRASGETLTSIVAGLADGYYHLPRFELPEALWETLDRHDGAGLIAAAREWGERFHLNEIVHSAGDHLFDGPGDFQLFLRQDLEAIGGFHEDMILGWHLDANVARRMRLLRGQVSSALDHLVGYHCDHTRQASAYHKADRVENDPARFVDEVTIPQIPEQMDHWGLPDAAIEEFRLNQASGARYLKGLQAAVPNGLSGFIEAAYTPGAYGQLDYSPGHVLPYLLDLVSCIPQTAAVAYIGARRDLFEGFARGWMAMGGAQPVAIPDSAPWLAQVQAPFRILPEAEWTQRSDLFVFEVGAELAASQMTLSSEESARLWTVLEAFRKAAAAEFERQRAGAAPRRALAVNAIHNFFEPQVFRAISASLTPFSTRIRHGYIADRVGGRMAAAPPAQRAVAAALGALEPLSAGELRRLRTLAAALDLGRLDSVDWSAAGKLGAELAALAGVAPDLFQPDHFNDILRHVTDRRPSRRAGGGVALSPDAGRGAPNRLARLEDWDDPDWAALAARLYPSVDHANLFSRELWMWGRVTLTQNLMRDIPPNVKAVVLVAGHLPEAHAFALAQLGYAVDIIDPVSLADGGLAAIDWRERYRRDGWVSPKPIGLAQDRAAVIASGFRYDAVLIVHNGILEFGRQRAADMLRHAAALLRPGGHLGFTALCQVFAPGGETPEHSLPPALVRAGAFAHALSDLTELALAGEIDDRLTPRSLDRLDEPSSPCPAPALVEGDGRQAQTLGAFAFRRRDQGSGDWGRLAEALGRSDRAAPSPDSAARQASDSPFTFAEIEDMAPSAGEPGRFGRLMEAETFAKPGVRRTPRGLEVRLGPDPAMVLDLDIGALDAGGYEMSVELYAPPTAPAGPLVAFALIAGGRLIAHQTTLGAPTGPRRVDIYFEVAQAAGAKGLRFAVKALGGDFDILDMTLR